MAGGRSSEENIQKRQVPFIPLFSRPLGDLEKAIHDIEATPGLDLIIVDTPPGREQRLLISKLIRRANFVLVPTSQSTADLELAAEFMAAALAFDVRAVFLLSLATNVGDLIELPRSFSTQPAISVPLMFAT